MNNLTVARAINSYEAGVTKPGFDGWGSRQKECGCAITAVLLHEKASWYPTLDDALDAIDKFGSSSVCEDIELTRPYMLGFTDAFDGSILGTSNQAKNVDIVWEDFDEAQYLMGYDHGKAVRMAVFDKYYPGGYTVTEGEL